MDHINRLKKAQALLEKANVDALLVDDPINLYYMTGISLSTGQLLIHKEGAHLFVDARYYELCEKASPYSVFLTSDISLLDALLKPRFAFIETLVFNSSTTPYKGYLNLCSMTESILNKSQGKRKISLIPEEGLIENLRLIKDADELQILREAAALGSEGFDFICNTIKEGVTEAEIAIELEIFWKKRGSKSLAFEPIIAFGSNSSMPHYRTDHKKLKKGHPILIDIGVNFKHYHSDMTRVVFFGTPDPKLLSIYEIVREAQRAAIDLCKPGVPIGKLDEKARQIISDRGYGDYFTHGLGHGVGLEIHEAPTVRNKTPYSEVTLKPGMVITIEPGIYLPGLGGVRLEDTIAITEDGHENLTKRSLDPKIFIVS